MIALVILLLWPLRPAVRIECSERILETTQDDCIVKSRTAAPHRVTFHGMTIETQGREHRFSTTLRLDKVEIDGKPTKVKRK